MVISSLDSNSKDTKMYTMRSLSPSPTPQPLGMDALDRGLRKVSEEGTVEQRPDGEAASHRNTPGKHVPRQTSVKA